MRKDEISKSYMFNYYDHSTKKCENNIKMSYTVKTVKTTKDASTTNAANRYAVLDLDAESDVQDNAQDEMLSNKSATGAGELLTVDDIDCGDEPVSSQNRSDVASGALTKDAIDELDVIDDTTLRQRYAELIKTHRHMFTRERLAQVWDSWRAIAPVIPGKYTSKLVQLRTFVLDPDQTELILHDRAPRSRFEYHTLCSALRLEHRSIDKDDEVVAKANVKVEPKLVDEDAGWSVVGRSHKAVKTQQDTKKTNVSNKHSDRYSTQRRNTGKEPGFESFASNKERAKHAREVDEKDRSKTMIITKPVGWCWEFTPVSHEQRQIDEDKLREKIAKHKEVVDNLRTKHCTNCNASAVSTGLYASKTLPGLFCELCINNTQIVGQIKHEFKHEYGRSFH